MDKKEFVAIALDPKYETFVIYVVSLSFITSPSSSLLNVDLFRRPQVVGLIVEEALTKVLAKYSDFMDEFFLDLESKLPKHIKINNYAIELVNGQQPSYEPIHSLGLMELETLKAYIETNLANRFIRPSKSPADAPILFDRKLNGSFQLHINYKRLNNFTIKNQYLLLLIGELLERLRSAS